jgi:hypothetical protein
MIFKILWFLKIRLVSGWKLDLIGTLGGKKLQILFFYIIKKNKKINNKEKWEFLCSFKKIDFIRYFVLLFNQKLITVEIWHFIKFYM